MSGTSTGNSSGSGTISLGGIILPASPFAVLAFGIWGAVDLSKAQPALLPPVAGLLAIILMVGLSSLWPIALVLTSRIEKSVESARAMASGCALSDVRWQAQAALFIEVRDAIRADIEQRRADAAVMQRVADALDRNADQVELIVKMQSIVDTMQETARRSR